MAGTNLDETLLRDGYVPAVQIAEILGVSLSSVHHWIETKAIRGKSLKITKRYRWYVHAGAALDKYGSLSASIRKQLTRLYVSSGGKMAKGKTKKMAMSAKKAAS